MKQKILANAKKERGMTLEKHIWNMAGKSCPFRANRGFDYQDENCLSCREREICQLDAQTRHVTIRNKLWVDFEIIEEEEEWPDTDVYFETNQGELFDEEILRSLRDEIRKVANFIISDFHNFPANYPDEILHPNTLQYFRNCFPEWLKFENELGKRQLRRSMEGYYETERLKAELFPPWGFDKAEDAENEDLDETLVIMNDWRGFPFDDLFCQTEGVPRKVISNFARDYFKWRNTIINTEKTAAKELGLFGIKKEEERWPMLWMLSKDNATIRNFMQSPHGKFFNEFMRYMELNKMNKHAGEEVAKKLKAGGRKCIVVQVDRKAASEYLKRRSELKNISTSEQKIYKFLKWMVKHDLIRKLGRPGRSEYTAYSIGKWTTYPDPETGEPRPGKMSLFIKQKNRKNLRKAVESEIW